MGEDERKRAETLYQRLLGVFPKPSAGADNVVSFPKRGPAPPPRKTLQAATLPLEQDAPASPQTRREERARGIEGLLRRLFEDLSKDD